MKTARCRRDLLGSDLTARCLRRVCSHGKRCKDSCTPRGTDGALIFRAIHGKLNTWIATHGFSVAHATATQPSVQTLSEFVDMSRLLRSCACANFSLEQHLMHTEVPPLLVGCLVLRTGRHWATPAACCTLRFTSSHVFIQSQRSLHRSRPRSHHFRQCRTRPHRRLYYFSCGACRCRGAD